MGAMFICPLEESVLDRAPLSVKAERDLHHILCARLCLFDGALGPGDAFGWSALLESDKAAAV